MTKMTSNGMKAVRKAQEIARYGRDDGDDEDIATHWQHFGDQVYAPTQRIEIHDRIPAGFYHCHYGQNGPYISGFAPHTDELIDFADGSCADIMDRLESFWTREEDYQKYGILHRIGLLLYGKQGTGKTAVLQQVCRRAVKRDHVVLYYGGNHRAFTGCLDTLRLIEPARPLVLVIEDLDEVIGGSWETGDFLQWMDGNNKTDRTIVLATTNFPENIDKRVTQRPRRFDRLIEIPVPNEDQRRVYFRLKLGNTLGERELDHWVKVSAGLTFAGMSELLISVKCAGEKLDAAARVLYDLENPKEEAAKT